MIVSHAHRFVFMHNPKVGGTSVRGSLQDYNDCGVWLYKTDPDPQSPLHTVDRAHIGIDEFAHFYPDLWADVQDYDFFALWREPEKWFYSSVSKYSRRHSSTDIRLFDPAQRRDFLMQVLDTLAGFGRAENIFDRLDFTHFRPQSIYLTTSHPSLRMHAFALSEIDQFYAAIGAQVGLHDLAPPPKANTVEQLVMPRGMARLAAARGLRHSLAKLPGIPWLYQRLKDRLKQQQSTGSSIETFDSSEADRASVAAFINDFYHSDIETLRLSASAEQPA